MPRQQPEFNYEAADTSRIPDDLIEGTSLLIHLRARGLLDAMGEHIRIRRQGGFPGLDVVLLLLVYFASGPKEGVRLVWEKKLRYHSASIGAVAGRKKLPSPPSCSRALEAVETDLIRPATDWLLGECSGVDEVMLHPACATWDVQGQPWHVFDLDPTVRVLRHRALPEDEDLPDAQRRSQDTGAPGYPGRKRGEIQFRRTTVQHSGSSAWLHEHLSPGNGELIPDLELGLDTIATTCDRLAVARNRGVARMDGEYGHVPGISACRERGLALLTRLNRASLYEDPDLLARLRNADWRPVIDSLSGPRRLAADLGMVTLPPGDRTRRADGSEYEPVTVRLVASIYQEQTGNGRGKVIGGWRIELFVADLPAEAWPAEDCVSLYFGRAAEENRFAQEDRELGLDRIISYELPGQELAAAVGLFVWNLRLVLGFRDDPPPQQVPAPRLRTMASDIVGPPKHWPPDPKVNRLLDSLDWEALLAGREGFSWNPLVGSLQCADGQDLYITSVRKATSDAERRGVIFRRPTGGCEDCGRRPDCFNTERERASKHIEFFLPGEVASTIAARLAETRQASKKHRTPPPPTPPIAVTPPRLLPAEARAIHRTRFNGATLHVVVEEPERQPTWPRLVAVDDAGIQRRRKTWQQRIEDYALPADTCVQIHVQGSPAFRRFLGERGVGRRRSASGSEKSL